MSLFCGSDSALLVDDFLSFDSFDWIFLFNYANVILGLTFIFFYDVCKELLAELPFKYCTFLQTSSISF